MAKAKQDLSNPQVQGQHRPSGEASGDETLNDAIRTGSDPATSAASATEVGRPIGLVGRQRVGDGGDADIRAVAQHLVRRTREKQGLPPKVEAPGAISRIATLLEPAVDD